jgi:hypothetical protein
MSVAQLAIYSHDEDMAPSDATIQYKVWQFLCLYDDINKNLMLPNVVTFNILRNNDDDDVNLEKTFPTASTTYRTWIHPTQDWS